MKKAIVLLSGGQDSTTCLFWALKNFDEVSAIGFDYGQTHTIELEYAKRIAEKCRIDFIVKDVKGLFAPSSLTIGSDHNEASKVNEDLPASFTAGRNLLFLTVAASYGADIGCTDIVTGVCQTDYSGYPDCRRNTIDAVQLSLSLGMGCGDFIIHTPLMYLTKAETWNMAAEMNIVDIIRDDTITDYDGDDTLQYWGRGNLNNPASRLRKQGYDEAVELGYITTKPF